MKFNEYSHRHGKELCQLLHADLRREIMTILTELPPFPHGSTKAPP